MSDETIQSTLEEFIENYKPIPTEEEPLNFPTPPSDDFRLNELDEIASGGLDENISLIVSTIFGPYTVLKEAYEENNVDPLTLWAIIESVSEEVEDEDDKDESDEIVPDDESDEESDFDSEGDDEEKRVSQYSIVSLANIEPDDWSMMGDALGYIITAVAVDPESDEVNTAFVIEIGDE